MAEKRLFLEDGESTGALERILACIEFSKAIMGICDLETLLTRVLERIRQLIPARNWSLLLLDPKTLELYFAVTVGIDPEPLKGLRLKLGEGIAGTVALSGRPIFIPDAPKDPRFCPRVDEVTGFTTRSIIALPLVVRNQVIGVFEVVNVEDEEVFTARYLPLLNILADYVAIAVDNVYNLQKLQARTFIDEVTGFYNTRYLAAKLDRYLEEVTTSGRELSLVFLDLDHFKRVVDAHGHLAGSKVLAEVARVLASCLGPEDSLVRYGGDEFIILLPGLGQEAALEVVRRLRRTLNQARFLQEEGLNLTVTASYGLATMPKDARDKDTLLRLADRAMFRGKDRGKDCIMVGEDLTPVT